MLNIIFLNIFNLIADQILQISWSVLNINRLVFTKYCRGTKTLYLHPLRRLSIEFDPSEKAVYCISPLWEGYLLYYSFLRCISYLFDKYQPPLLKTKWSLALNVSFPIFSSPDYTPPFFLSPKFSPQDCLVPPFFSIPWLIEREFLIV